MENPDPPTSIPGTADDKPFQFGDELTVYEAAMVYAGRHPYPRMFGPYDDGNRREYCLRLLKLGLSEKRWPRRRRVRARRSWEIYCELGQRIKQGQITPIRSARDLDGEIDLVDTVIAIADLMQVVHHRGDKCPKYLRGFQTKTTARAAKPNADDIRLATELVKGLLAANRNMSREDARQVCAEKFPGVRPRTFERRVWKVAREALSLGRAMSPGRPKLNRVTK